MIKGLLDDSLDTLKDFQIATVKSVMNSFEEKEGSGRVLVADEVGLGKTIVAKGVIAELLKAHLEKEQKKPLRVTYICSNLTLANENRDKLAVFRGEDQIKYVREPSYSRLLEVAVIDQKQDDNGKLLEICSLTPSTSFNLTQGHGNWRERLIIYFALIEHKNLVKSKIKLSNFFSDSVNNWTVGKKHFVRYLSLDLKIIVGFHELLDTVVTQEEKNHCEIKADELETWLDCLKALCNGDLKFKKSEHKTRFRGFIRSLLARACAKYLTADLFILDEFQRFKALLSTDNKDDESLVAREIFNNKQETKILLLSATPFKALTQIDDDEKGDSHAEELNFLLSFLCCSNNTVLDRYDKNRQEIQKQILALSNPKYSLTALSDDNKTAIELILKKYICRTERGQISKVYEDTFTSLEVDSTKYFSNADISAFKSIDQLGIALQKVSQGRYASQIMEFYKATPWPLSFLSGYHFKHQLDIHHDSIGKSLSKSREAWLSRKQLSKYQLQLEGAPHAKMQILIKKLFETPSEELLWIPPSLPHYPLEGSFKNQDHFSKTLLFSSWAMVPRALSGLISYEAERRLLLSRRGVKKEYYKKKKPNPKVKFADKSSLVGWSLVYPSRIMMDMKIDTSNITLSILISKRQLIFNEKLKGLEKFEQGVTKGDRWYALAPFLLDLDEGYDEYFESWKNSVNFKQDTLGAEKSFNKLCKYIDLKDGIELGAMPSDLAKYLAYLSVAGLGVCVARALSKNWSQNPNEGGSATKVALALVSMFNKHESQSVLSKHYYKGKNKKYFKSIIFYCADGDFQAVIDEYSHLLKDAGLSLYNDDDRQVTATSRLVEVLGIRTSSVACQFSEDRRKSSQKTTDKSDKENNKHSLRCHYAVPLGNQKISDERGVMRIGHIRDAFNSPFRPFMLNSTSIGQEGLDFHWYCNRVVHWNLPSNPIDIEQREGRVNRYKSLLVRRRLAENYPNPISNGQDMWKQLFQLADEESKSTRLSDLTPYWHLPKGTTKIERFVPIMPMSKDEAKFKNILKVLSLYRLAFGQPRQEELMEYLLGRDFSSDDQKIIKKKLMINLTPLVM